MGKSWMKVLFIVSGLYDGILGIAFLVMAGRLFEMFQVTAPNHFGYVKFPALLLIVFALMFFRIAGDPVKYRALIPMGIGLKIAYCGTVFFYELTAGIPAMWLPWAWADLGFLALFVVAYRATGRAGGAWTGP
jgi:hypothetical protein